MSCLNPLTFYTNNHDGTSTKLMVPCRKCLGCSLDYSKEWSFRCLLEASLHRDNCFVTLTYDNSNCPYEISKKDVQDFLKRLRKAVFPLKIRYYCCGEYGSKYLRPHYHLILFGYDFPDRYFFQKKTVAFFIVPLFWRGFGLMVIVLLEMLPHLLRFIVANT